MISKTKKRLMAVVAALIILGLLLTIILPISVASVNW